MDWFGAWLDAQQTVQVEAFGVDPFTAGGDYLRYNLLAAFTELGEVAQEVPGWKPWNDVAPWEFDQDALTEEIVDVLHFLGNLILWAGITGPELTDLYQRKLAENRRRQDARR